MGMSDSYYGVMQDSSDRRLENEAKLKAANERAEKVEALLRNVLCGVCGERLEVAEINGALEVRPCPACSEPSMYAANLGSLERENASLKEELSLYRLRVNELAPISGETW